MQKKNKLKDVWLNSVDVVARGANQDAHIRLVKNETGEVVETNPLRKAYDYLRHLFEDGDGDPAPSKDVTITKADIQKEYHQYFDAMKDTFDLTLEDESYSAEERMDILHKNLCEFHAFMYPAAEKWANDTVLAKSMTATDIVKSADMAEERWKCCGSLEASINSILNDNELDEIQKADMITKSVDEFSDTYKKIFIKEGDDTMNMDNLTPEEQTILKSLLAKAECKKEEDPKPAPQQDPEIPPVKEPKKKPAEKAEIEEEDLPESVRKALERSNQFIVEMEQRDMQNVAKKYEVLGEKPEELAKTLYDLKKSNEAMYKSCIAMLDNQIEMINKSGLFTEIGKSGVQGSGNGAVEKAENLATEIMKSDATLTRDQAMAKVWETHPELMAEYEGR